jgi:hypothetical protein
MKPFTFSTMELLQQTDDALRMESGIARPDRLKLIWLNRRRKQLAARLRRVLAPAMLAGA